MKDHQIIFDVFGTGVFRQKDIQNSFLKARNDSRSHSDTSLDELGRSVARSFRKYENVIKMAVTDLIALSVPEFFVS